MFGRRSHVLAAELGQSKTNCNVALYNRSRDHFPKHRCVHRGSAQELAEEVFGQDMTLQCFQFKTTAQSSKSSTQVIHRSCAMCLTQPHQCVFALRGVWRSIRQAVCCTNTDQRRAGIFTKALAPAKFPAALRRLSRAICPGDSQWALFAFCGLEVLYPIPSREPFYS